MTANESQIASGKEADDESVSYTTEYSDTERVDVGAGISVLAAGEIGLSVDHYQHPDGSGDVSLHTHDDKIRGKFFMSPDRAEWLADRLREHAEKLRHTDG